MKDYNIPQDIKEYVAKNNKKLFLKWILFTLLVAVVIFYVNTRSTELSYKKIAPWISAALLILPFLLTKAYKLFDKTVCGIVEKVELSYHTRYDKNGYAKYNFTEKTYVERLTLHIKLDNDKIKDYVAFEQTIGRSHKPSHTNDSPIMSHYEKGDRVLRIAGTSFFQVIGKENTEAVCAVCGTLNKSENKDCSFCGHTLIIK